MMIKEQLRAFILDNSPLESLANDEDIFESGAVSSMFVMQLISYIERLTGMTVQGADLTFENFTSLETIQRFVNDKRKAGSEQ